MGETPELQQAIRRWLTRVLKAKRWKAAEMARQAGLSPSTVSRALEPGSKLTMSTATIAKIAQVSGIAAPPELIGAGSGNGSAEHEAERWVEAIGAGAEPADNLEVWVIRSRALDLQGFLPGDFVLVSRTAAAIAGDVVCLQVYDRHGNIETIFRLYDPPYAVTVTADPASRRKPQIVDEQSAVIKGVVARLVRVRKR